MADEIKRDTVDYRDPTPFDGSKLQPISEISKAIRHKTYGGDTREALAQQGEALVKIMQETGGNQSAEVAAARGNFEMLGIREDAQDGMISKKADKNYIDDYLSKINFSPEAFKSVDEMTEKYPNGTAGLLLNSSDGFLYFWGGSAWTKGSSYQSTGFDEQTKNAIKNSIAGAPTNIINGEALEPFNNLNTAPLNSIVTYGTGYENVLNIPQKNSEGATVLTFDYRSDDAAYTGAVQLVYQPSGKVFHRISWGTHVNWGNWYRQGESITGIGIRTSYSDSAPDDLNTLPDNSVVTISYDTTKALNFPVSNYSGGATIATLAYSQYATSGGSVQLAMLADGRMFRRIKWGVPTKYREWLEFKQNTVGGDRLISLERPNAPYDDLNSLKSNGIVSYSEIRNIKNIPSDISGEATIMTYGYSNDALIRTQFLTDRIGSTYIRSSNSNNVWSTWKLIDDDYKLPSLSMFKSIGVIGDSYASGYIVGEDYSAEHYPISWPQILARKNGISAINFSKGGLTTRSWLTDDKGLSLLNTSDEQNLYILNLGINDARLGEGYLGTISDINTGADTFYGNYAKIIKAVIDKSPNSKIIIATNPFTGADNTLYNDAVLNLGNYFELPTIKLQDDRLFTSDYFSKGLIGGHPTVTLYSAMSMAFERLLLDCVVQCSDYFNVI